MELQITVTLTVYFTLHTSISGSPRYHQNLDASGGAVRHLNIFQAQHCNSLYDDWPQISVRCVCVCVYVLILNYAENQAHVGPQLWARSQGNQGKQDPGRTLKKVRVQRVRWGRAQGSKRQCEKFYWEAKDAWGGGANKAWGELGTRLALQPHGPLSSDFIVTSPCLLKACALHTAVVHAKYQDSAGGETREPILWLTCTIR